MQRKKQVGECWVCVIFFARVVVFTLHRGFRGSSPENCFSSRNMLHFLGGFRHMVFFRWFSISVKELGLLTNPGHWVRVLDVIGSYMYIVL
jgi:hypothetical protein